MTLPSCGWMWGISGGTPPRCSGERELVRRRELEELRAERRRGGDWDGGVVEGRGGPGEI